MSFTVPPQELIDYPPEVMESFYYYNFEYIDNLHFVLPPDRFLSNPAPYVEIARRIFLEANWEGDGEIGLIWLPPFVLPSGFLPPSTGLTGLPCRSERESLGILIWHVKQLNDGISFLLSPIELPFDGFDPYRVIR